MPTAEGMAATNAARFMESWRGDATWQQQRTGGPAADWPLLQRLSFVQPEAFWPHLLAQLSMRFHRQPDRSAAGCCLACNGVNVCNLLAVPARLQLYATVPGLAACPGCRILELRSEPDACRWLPGARFNIAECALSGELEEELLLCGMCLACVHAVY